MRLALLALAVGTFGLGTTEFVIMGLLPEVADDLGVSVSTAGHLISAYALGVVIGAPLLTALSTRLPRRSALLLFMGVFTLGNLLSAIGPNFEAVAGFRVLTGLPHGAYFGCAAVVAAQMAGEKRQAQAVSRVFLGLTVANIVGVPAATVLGQSLGWRATFAIVGLLGVVTMAGIMTCVPRIPKPEGVRLRHELSGLADRQVLLGLLTAVVGCSGVFAVYSYISPMLTELAGMSSGGVSIVLSLFGVGMTLGSLGGGWLADRSLRKTVYVSLSSLAVVLASFVVAAHNPWTAGVAVVLLGVSCMGTSTAVQMLLMTKAAHAPSLASASNHSAFNLANAGGAWIGGATIGAGLGWTSPAVAGAALAVVGLGIALAAGVLDRNRPSRIVASAPERVETPQGAEH